MYIHMSMTFEREAKTSRCFVFTPRTWLIPESSAKSLVAANSENPHSTKDVQADCNNQTTKEATEKNKRGILFGEW